MKIRDRLRKWAFFCGYGKKMYICGVKKLEIMNDYKQIIKVNSGIRFGKPCIRGTRIAVYDVLSWLASGMNFDEIISDFPELTRSDILACLAYAADREHKLQYA
jgi:uncharacterized protein (DUF433 family)